MSAILRDFPASRIIVLTAHHADDDVMKAVAAGACSYLIKGTPKEALVDAIRAVYRGEQRLSPQIAGHFAERVEVPTLNLLDQMVLRLIALGRSSGEIAEKLGLDASKAKGHVSGVIEKLGARDRKEAIMRAMQRGLLPSNVRDR
jgi:DNA-binding NarL/FixJ family response regulator